MSQTHTGSPAANRRGMIAVTLGMAAYTVNDTFVKLVARELPFGEVIFLRGVLSVIVLTAALMIVVDLRSLVTAFNSKVLWRALFDALATAFFVAALVHMKIAELSAVVLTSPLILTALAAFVSAPRSAGEAGARSAWALSAHCSSSNRAQAASTCGRWSG